MYISLKLKIVTIISIFFSIVFFINMLYDLNSSKIQLSKYLDNLNTSSSKLLIKNIRADLYNLNYTNAKNTIDSFDNEYFKNIYILNKDGYIFVEQNENKIRFEKFTNFNRILNSQNKNEFIYFQSISISNKVLGYLIIENNDKIFEQMKSEKTSEIIKLFIILLLITIILSYFISLIITKPIDNIIKSIKEVKTNNGLHFKHSNDEYGYLSLVIEENHKNIQNLNNNLELLVKEEVEKNKDKDKILQTQSLRASMGDMMDAVAHQWVQPLNMIALVSHSLYVQSRLGDINEDDISSAHEKIEKQIDHMSNTLREFRSFFRENKKPEYVVLSTLIESTLILLKNDIIKNKLKVSVHCEEEKKVYIIPNEFKHVFINIINNAKDSFEENEIQNREIDIYINSIENRTIVNIEDNAGGINEDIIENVFDANVSSKKEGKGSGIGLYMSKMIIEKIQGTIDVQNKNKGVCFTITLNS